MGLIECKQAATKLAMRFNHLSSFNGVESGCLVNKKIGIRIYFKHAPPRHTLTQIPEEIDGYIIEVVDESKPQDIS